MMEDWATVDGGGPAASGAGRVAATGMMGGMGGTMGRRGGMMGSRRRGRQPAGDEPLREPVYDAYTINGRIEPTSPPLRVRRGDRVRLRFLNPAPQPCFSSVSPATPWLSPTPTAGRCDR